MEQKVHGYLLERRKEAMERREQGIEDNFEQELEAHVQAALRREEMKENRPRKERQS